MLLSLIKTTMLILNKDDKISQINLALLDLKCGILLFPYWLHAAWFEILQKKWDGISIAIYTDCQSVRYVELMGSLNY